MYRWDFVTNTLTEALNLQPATGEAYTSTAIGPDGQMYAINNSILFAVGSPAQATSVSVFQGTAGKGTLADVWAVDGLCYSTGSVAAPAGSVAAIEADFSFPGATNSGVSVTVSAAARSGVTGFVYAYDYSSRQFIVLGDHAMLSSQALFTGTAAGTGHQFIGPNGQVRIVVRGVLPPHVSPGQFTLAVDEVLCQPS